MYLQAFTANLENVTPIFKLFLLYFLFPGVCLTLFVNVKADFIAPSQIISVMCAQLLHRPHFSKLAFATRTQKDGSYLAELSTLSICRKISQPLHHLT